MSGADDTTRELTEKRDDSALGSYLGHFRLQRKLGEGGFGVVYQAFDTDLQREVALKVPRIKPDSEPELWSRFITEARAAAKLEHPNICPVYHINPDGERPYIVMSFIRGLSMREALRQRSRPPASQVAQWVRSIASALAYAHAQGVLHRDLKPENIMIREDGEPVVMDFGLARITESQTKITVTGQVMGTPAYMSPEQAEGLADKIGPPTDIYSLGVVLYLLLAGRAPFEGPVFQVISQIGRGVSKRPSDWYEAADVDPELEAICLKAMALQIKDRYASMEQLRDELDSWIARHPEPQDVTMGSGITFPTFDADPAPTEAASQQTLQTIGDTQRVRNRIQRLTKGKSRKTTRGKSAPRNPVAIALFASTAVLLLVVLVIFAFSRSGESKQKQASDNDPPTKTQKSEHAALKTPDAKSSETKSLLPKEPKQPYTPLTNEQKVVAKFRADQEGRLSATKKKALPKVDKSVDLKELVLVGEAAQMRDDAVKHRKDGDKDKESDVLLKLGNLLLKQDEFTAAYFVAKRWVELAGSDLVEAPFAHYFLARVYSASGNYQDAVTSYERALRETRILKGIFETRPDGSSIVAKLMGLNFNGLGNAHKHLRQYDKAEKAYLEAIKILKPHVKRASELQLVYSNYGSLLSVQGKHDEAVEMIQKSINICRILEDRSAEAEAHINLGNAYSRVGKTKQALLAYTDAEGKLGFNPDYEAKTKLLGNWILALYADGQKREARFKFRTLKAMARPNDQFSQSLIKQFGPLLETN